MTFMKTLKSATVLLLICFYVNSLRCVDVSNAGGGSDIGNPARACVVDSDNRPVAHAFIRAIADDSWYSSVLGDSVVVADSVFTDQSGHFYLDSLPAGTYNLQVDHYTAGAFVPHYITHDSRDDTVRIKPYSSISGRVISNSGIPAAIRLEGSDYQAKIGPGGFYWLPQVAEGDFTVLSMSADSQWTVAGDVQTISGEFTTTTNHVSFGSLLIHDFEPQGQSAGLSNHVSGDSIYHGVSSESDGSSTYDINTDSYNGDYALHGQLSRNDNLMSWALIGFFLGMKNDNDSLWDFSSATGLSFFAKGAGEVTVSIESQILDDLGEYNHYGATITLSEQWQHYTIPFDVLVFPFNTPPPLSWQEVSEAIKRIEITVVNANAEFWIDDLTVHGMDLTDVY